MTPRLASSTLFASSESRAKWGGVYACATHIRALKRSPFGSSTNQEKARPSRAGHPKLNRPLVLRRVGLVFGFFRGFRLRSLVLARKNLAVAGVDLNLLDSRLSGDLDVEGVDQATVLGLQLGVFHGGFRRVFQGGESRPLRIGPGDLCHGCELFAGGARLRMNGA